MPAVRARRRILPALLACVLAAAATPCGASDDHELARRALERGEVLPLRDVLDQVERDYRGRVLKIEFEREDGRFVYEIRLLQDDGRLVKLEVDATTGEVLKMKRKGP